MHEGSNPSSPTIKEPSKPREHNTLYNANIKVFAKRDDKTCSNKKVGTLNLVKLQVVLY